MLSISERIKKEVMIEHILDAEEEIKKLKEENATLKKNLEDINYEHTKIKT